MIALDYTVIVQVVAFLVLWFLLSKLLFGPFLREALQIELPVSL